MCEILYFLFFIYYSLTIFEFFHDFEYKILVWDLRIPHRAPHFMDGDTPKIRAVYGYPATMTFGEAQFALP